MRDLPDEALLGDLLVDCGAISRAALDAALQQQESGEAVERAATKSIGQILVEQKIPTRSAGRSLG